MDSDLFVLSDDMIILNFDVTVDDLKKKKGDYIRLRRELNRPQVPRSLTYFSTMIINSSPID